VIDDKPIIGVALNRNLGSPTAPGEAVEAELDRLIQRRSQQKDPDEGSELWRESVRAYEEKRRRMARFEWHLHHTAQAERLRRTLEALASHHEEEAARLMDIEPKGAA
jgi:ABC-type phosphonate transport system ATPase subunit